MRAPVNALPPFTSCFPPLFRSASSGPSRAGQGLSAVRPSQASFASRPRTGQRAALCPKLKAGKHYEAREEVPAALARPATPRDPRNNASMCNVRLNLPASKNSKPPWMSISLGASSRSTPFPITFYLANTPPPNRPRKAAIRSRPPERMARCLPRSPLATFPRTTGPAERDPCFWTAVAAGRSNAQVPAR